MIQAVRIAAAMAGVLLLSPAAHAESREELANQVRQAETAFAATMAKRDLNAFASFIADEAIFFGRDALRGRDAVVADWAQFYEGPTAPFSWRPEIVEVLDSGQLAISSGPVFDPSGKQVATFNSIWRREADGRWKVLFDKGSGYCPPPATKQ
jgi:ketosteroid isomerase-like protein